MPGNQELKEIVSLAFSMIIPIVQEAKRDGFQASDLIAFVDSEDFKSQLQLALKDVRQIVPEVLDLDFEEAFDLSAHVLNQVKMLVIELKK
jgi:hypothetical protein